MPATARKSPVLCRHCGKGNVNRPRGLCHACYYTPAIQALYASKNSPDHRAARMRLCTRCGNPTGKAETKADENVPAVCMTCRLPKQLREEIHGRLSRMEKLAEQGLPLFV